LRPPSVFAVSVDNTGNEPAVDPYVDSVVMSHIETMGSLAPGANIVIYFAPNTDRGFTDAIRTARLDTNHKLSVLVIDWGVPESYFSTSARAALNAELEAAAKQNITVVTSAGNAGVTDGVSDGRPHVDFPGSSPWVVAVGRTRLVANGTEIESEKVWNDGAGGATGGGVSDVFALPDWQRDTGVPAREDGSLGRGMPDVSAGGSGATLWASLIVRLNQGLGRNLGYFNPKLYREIGPAGILRPITEGDNGNGILPGYKARMGWSAAAGWGTPDGRKLLIWLRAHPD
jgi:kumamolisin